MTAPSPTPASSPATHTARAPRPPLATVLALGTLAYVLSELVQEALGHGLACVLGGGEWRGFSSAWSICEASQLSESARRWMAAAGAVMGLLVGGLSLVWLRIRPPRSGDAALGLWLFSAVCLFSAAGELMALPLFRFGDFEEVLTGALGGPGPRMGLTALGVGAAVWAFVALRARLDHLLLPGGASGPRQAYARWLTWPPFLAVGCVLMPAAALLNVLGLHHAVPTALTTVGSTSLLFWLPLTLDARGEESPPHRSLSARRWLWLLGLGLVLFTLLGLGPGIPVMRPG